MLMRFSDIDQSFAMMDEVRSRMSQLFDGFGGFGGGLLASVWPRLNLLDTGSALLIKAEVPGLTEKDIELTINEEVLTLSGERKPDAPEGYSVHRQERAPIRFARSLTLPCKVVPEKVSASIKDGVLSVTLPKVQEAQPRQIAVRAS